MLDLLRRLAPQTTVTAGTPRSPRTLLNLLAIGVGISGCNLDSNFSDLGEKLLDPDVQGFDTPGKQLLVGPYFDLSIQADADGARYALARNESGALSIVDFAAKTTCHTESVLRYGNALLAEGQQALIPLLLQDAQGNLQLGFSTFQCDVLEFRAPSAGMPIDELDGMASGSGTSLLIRTPQQGLELIDPWEGTSQPLAASVRTNDPVKAYGYYLWVDNGRIVIQDLQHTPGVEEASFGQHVIELGLSPRDGELSYIEAGAAGAGGTLYRADAIDREPQAIAEDVCGLRYLDIGSSRKLSYLSPCAARHLVLRDRSDDSTLDIADGVAGSPVAYLIDRDWQLAYVTTASPNTPTGTLWMRKATPGAEPTAIADNARANSSTVTPDGGGLLTMLDWSSTGGGRLVEWRGGDALSNVADRVIEVAPLGQLENQDLTLLANFDGVTGDLLHLHPDLTTEVLASGVPQRSASEDAFLANFDGSQGELRLFNRKDGSSQVLGSGVSRGSFRFAQQFKGVMMLTNRDPESNTSTFEVRLLDSDQSFVLNTNVTEAREVAFPSPGVLYNVVDGEQAGVWFSKTL
jgi:hypothetical protein